MTSRVGVDFTPAVDIFTIYCTRRAIAFSCFNFPTLTKKISFIYTCVRTESGKLNIFQEGPWETCAHGVLMFSGRLFTGCAHGDV